MLMLAVAMIGAAQPASSPPMQFPVGHPARLDELPAGRFRSELEQLPPAAQERAWQWLRSFHFPEQDVASLHTDTGGGICYACQFSPPPPTAAAEADMDPPPVGQASVPVSPFPEHLKFHSRPGAANVLFINFSGETVSNTEWNTVVGRTSIPAVAFSTDSDLTTFSDAEQVAIKRIWQRMAEDYAPFNINVTTERPSTFNNRTAVALITRNTDANGGPNPYNWAGGVAYVNVFNTTQYAKYRPAWIYHDNLGNNESYIAEAASHEIGHNLGLSHDGTSSAEYYGGHGSGDISWGPLMGTGYNRNVSQWSKGEYYLANNPEDDLATIAGKISYRTDDHGNTPGTATALTISGGTNIVSTTPENDPANTTPANKGVIERNTDVDVFSFVTGSGAVRLDVRPWIMPSGTRGGNLDILLELYNEAGTRLLTNNPATQTTALIQTNLTEGRYYLHVKNSGAGDPFSSTPTGYTPFASLGQYFISGYVTETITYIAPPVAELQVTDLTQSGQTSHALTVTYSDDVAIAVATIDSNDIRVTGPNGYDQLAQFISLNTSGNGTPRTATYAVTPPGGGAWSPAHNGTYTVFMRTNQVADTEGAYVAAGQLGQFQVSVPVAVYTANMDVDPGWTLQPDWQYGTPTYTSGGPTSGYTGTKIIGYNLGGNYPNNLSVKYATTPEINASGSSSLTLRFQRWLGLRNIDSAFIQASTDGINWVSVWSSAGAGISDNGWQLVQYSLPGSVAGSTSLRLRWGLSSTGQGGRPASIGWNIDDVELLGDGVLDTSPPVPSLNVADLTLGGSPSHSCSVTYTDDTAVRLSSLDSTNLLVTGPNSYSNLVEFVGADLPMDGSPITATYSISAPGGAWDETDNGTYTITLLEGAVEDTLNNATPQQVLGTFNVVISAAPADVLSVTPTEGLTASGTVGGPFSPGSLSYTLTNAGGSTLEWSVSKTASWVSLSATGGSLAAGAATNVTVSLNSAADSLAAGSYQDTVSFVNTTSGNGNTSRGVSLTVNSAGQLAVSPAGDLAASGTVGGPFNPSSLNYTLTNSGGSTLNWSVSKLENWVSLSATSGSLAAGASTTVTVSLNSGANSLSAGSYSDTVSFANTTTGNGNTSRGVSLTVNSAGQLNVSPAGDLISSGTVGGPFSPGSLSYTLTNAGSSTLEWSVSKTAAWVSLSATSGSLAAGDSTTVTVALNSAADSLAAGSYQDTVSFANTTSGNGNTSRGVSLTVNSAGQLNVSPAGDLISSGPLGGPFSPSSLSYTLTNSGGSTLNWSVSKTAAWVSLSATSGSLVAGAATTVTVSVNSAAESLGAGSYDDTVSFVNTTTGNGNTSRGVSLTVNSPGDLLVTPAGDLAASGTVGGPFNPSSIQYTLTNSGGSTLNWSASKLENWVSLSATSGSLAAGASTTVTVSLNSGANSLSAGSYSDTVSFVNTTTGNGNTSRGVSLTVNSAGQLNVSPAGDLISSGPLGGPFSPGSLSYTLTNSGGSTLNWSASKLENWVSLSATSGSLAAGEATNITVSLNATADSLAAGNYQDTVSFANTTSGNGNTSRAVSLTVNSAGQLVVTPAEDFTSSGAVGGPFAPESMGYVLTNAGGTTLEWSVSKTADWLEVSANAGVLAAGESTNLLVFLDASGLMAGEYADTLGFTNLTTGSGNTSRSVTLTIQPAIEWVELAVTINNPDWGSVSPANGTYPAGDSVELTATAETYFQFLEWKGDISSTANPLVLVLTSNTTVHAVFGEVFTTNFPTPHWWLATYGYTNDLETVVTNIGANDMALWQSYIAGLNPNDPASQLRLTGESLPAANAYVLSWDAVTGRIYTIWSGANPSDAFTPMPGAVELPAPINRFTNTLDGSAAQRFYRLEVQKP